MLERRTLKIKRFLHNVMFVAFGAGFQEGIRYAFGAAERIRINQRLLTS
jgi:aromatic ring hydroxylase